ncbi:MAG: RecX family transcriptional regulator [Sphingomicrobium sp.]
MSTRSPRRARPPLDADTLNELALRYVGRFATTRSKLQSYLTRKLRERGWTGSSEPDPGAIAERLAGRGYIDDASYALSRSRTLTGRGYGKARLVQSLRVAGVDEADSVAARDHAETEAGAAALRFAQRRRIGPFATSIPDPKSRERLLAAMVRAGHSFTLSRFLVNLSPGAVVDPDELSAATGYSDDK